MDPLKMYFLLKNGGYSIAMLVYQRVARFQSQDLWRVLHASAARGQEVSWQCILWSFLVRPGQPSNGMNRVWRWHDCVNLKWEKASIFIWYLVWVFHIGISMILLTEKKVTPNLAKMGFGGSIVQNTRVEGFSKSHAMRIIAFNQPVYIVCDRMSCSPSCSGLYIYTVIIFEIYTDASRHIF